MQIGDIVTVLTGIKHGRPHVVVHADKERVKLCYCGTARWYTPAWYRIENVVPVRGDLYGSEVRRCKRLLLAAREQPRPDGWIQIQAGSSYNQQDIIVGNVDVPWSWSAPYTCACELCTRGHAPTFSARKRS